MNPCVVSLGIGQRFSGGLVRQVAGLMANRFEGDIIQAVDWPDGCPTHAEVPYGFKPWMVDRARSEGYEQVLWLDSACVPVKPLGPLFDLIALDGVVLPVGRRPTWEWCSDACAEKMGVSRSRLLGMCPTIWACVMGFDFRHATANEFLDRWLAYSRDGVCFHGAYTNENGEVSADPNVKGHRHDQAVASILAFEMGLSFTRDIVEYDFNNTLLLDGYESNLRQPDALAYILAQHDVKTSRHSW